MKVALSRILVGAVLGTLAVVGVGCSGGSETTTAPPPVAANSSTAFVFIGDAPPPGSTILKFEITLTSAALCPQVSGDQCQGSPQPSLLTEPVEIELKQLELESAFLSLTSVPAGSFQGIRLTFANPELTILLPDNPTPQELEPPLTVSMVTPSFSGGLLVEGNNSFGLLVDFNIFDSIQSSGNTITGITPSVTLVTLPAIAGAEIEELEDVTGVVANLNKTCPTGTFTLIQSSTGIPIQNIHIDDATEFDDGDEDDDGDGALSCDTLANDQVVEADLELRAGSSLQSAQFFAEEIELVNAPGEDELEGFVFQVNSATQFVLSVLEEEGVPNVPAGGFVTVNLNANTEFELDEDDLSINSSEFDSGEDLVAGQRVEVDVANGSLVMTGQCSPSDNCTVTAEELELEEGTLTGRVASINGSSFTIDQLPSVFGNADMTRPISTDCQNCFVGSILVTTSSQTEFDNGLSGVGSLVAGDIVRVRGLLLKNTFAGPAPGSGTPRLEATRVRRNND